MMNTITLNNGVQMPNFGFGTWQIPARQTSLAVLSALQTGYRLVDTSLVYWNEPEVGEAIRNSGLPREEIFVTTKLEAEYQGKQRTVRGFARSLSNLDTGYIDLYLIHWPVRGLGAETWKAMEDLVDSGQCRAIGVSNYAVAHLEEVLEHSRIVPAVNQIELHPFQYPREVVNFCRDHGIQVESYSPLGQGENLSHPALTGAADRHGRTPAQVVLRWHVQHGFIPIPRSTNRDHIAENFQVWDFELTQEEMEELDALDRGAIWQTT
jgi:diketogulonate reductase-like aldo/keto reductase